MTAIVHQPQIENLAAGLGISTLQEDAASRSHAFGLCALNRRDHVLHEQWGLGRVLAPAAGTNEEITIYFKDGQRTVPAGSLRRLLPRTVLARLIERTTPNVSTWMVRKADEQGAIEPDVKARFAGHAVHYYDEARIPDLIQQVSRQDSWPIGTLVFHHEYGPGRVLAGQSRVSGQTEEGNRLVYFFAHSSSLAVRAHQLRRLLPSRTVANRIGLNRKTFARLAQRKGICPDWIEPENRVREFYDEGRIEEIRKCWSASDRADSFPPGCLVMDRQGEIARVEFRDASGQLQVRYLDAPGTIQSIDPANVRKLVSLRELARSERMSRYKLNRLLSAAGIGPVHQGAKVTYFDAKKAREAVRDRLGREHSAVSLKALAGRTGVSSAVLARKVRQGCVCTTGQAAHAVDTSEAARIEHVVRALQSRHESLTAFGICRLQPRGRAGFEVAGWDIAQLIKVAQALTAPKRTGLFAQVAWLCDGAGRRRLAEALNSYILAVYKTTGEDRQLVRDANVLLALLAHLPEEFARYRPRLACLASGVPQFHIAAHEVRRLARDAGLHTRTSYERFRAQINDSVADLLAQDRTELAVGKAEPFLKTKGDLYADDDLVGGAVIVCVHDLKPEVGRIVRVEQKAWNAAARRWDKTVVVRFAHEERRMNPYMRTTGVLLRAAEATALLHTVRARLQTEQISASLFSESTQRKAS